MKLAELQQKLGDQLLSRPGWQQHPGLPGCYVHAETKLRVIAFPESISVVFGEDTDDRAVHVKSGYYPAGAIETIIEVADALVLKRIIDIRRGNPRKGGTELPSGDMLLLLCAQLGDVSTAQAATDPQWTSLAGWVKPPAISTIAKAVNELRNADLIDTGWGDRRIRLTPRGRVRAAELADRLGVPLPEGVHGR